MKEKFKLSFEINDFENIMENGAFALLENGAFAPKERMLHFP